MRATRAGADMLIRRGSWRSFAAALSLVLVPTIVHAQARGGQDAIVHALVHDAIDAYQGLDIDGAMQRLTEAQHRCGRRNCSPHALAEVQVTLGVVLMGGRNDRAGAERVFAEAIASDPTIAVDPTLTTPEIAAAFSHARHANVPAPTQHLLHTPVQEQLSHTPVPIYVETGATSAARADLFYRLAGGTTWTTVPMQHVANGWGAEVPCDAVSSALEYYVWAYDTHDVPIAAAGSEDVPNRIEVVETRTQPAPSMPGQLPPTRCAQASASPAPSGSACAQASDCAAGLICHERVCAAPTPQQPATTGRAPWFAIDAGAGVGFAAVGGTPGYDEAVSAVPGGPAMCPTGISCPAMPSGVSVIPYVWVGGRYHITRRIGVGAAVRWQPDSAPRTNFSSFLLSLRGYYAFLGNGFESTGFGAMALLGTGVGQIQAKPPSPSSAMPNAQTTGHIVTGLNNIHFGARAEYAFTSLLHVGAELVFQFEFPRFLFDVDAQIVAGVHY